MFNKKLKEQLRFQKNTIENLKLEMSYLQKTVDKFNHEKRVYKLDIENNCLAKEVKYLNNINERILNLITSTN